MTRKLEGHAGGVYDIVLTQLQQNDVLFVTEVFDGKRDVTQRLSVDHALDTANILQQAMTESREVPSHILKLWRACLGHDLLEDTGIAREYLETRWGEQVVIYIEDMTNRKGDGDFEDYLQHLTEVSEDSALIKLADITSNAINSVKCFTLASPQWVAEFWIPLLKKYVEIFSSREFVVYPKTAGLLLAIIQLRLSVLENKLQAISLNVR